MAKKKDYTVSASTNGVDYQEVDFEKAAEAMKKLNSHSSKYDIKKAKLKDDMFLEVEYSEITPDKNDVKKTCSAAVHEDLKQVFSRLDGPITSLCFQYNDEGSLNHRECFCNGISIGGDGQGVTLIGRRKFEDGKGINLTSPFARYEDHSDIEHIIENLKQEVLMYLFEGKHAPEAQMNLFDENMVEEDL